MKQIHSIEIRTIFKKNSNQYFLSSIYIRKFSPVLSCELHFTNTIFKEISLPYFVFLLARRLLIAINSLVSAHRLPPFSVIEAIDQGQLGLLPVSTAWGHHSKCPPAKQVTQSHHFLHGRSKITDKTHPSKMS